MANMGILDIISEENQLLEGANIQEDALKNGRDAPGVAR
jgi:hypothetical protein